MDRLPARELHDDLRLRDAWRQLYYDDADVAEAPLRPRQPARAARRRASGRSATTATRTELRKALAEKFLDDRTAPLAGVSALAPSQATEALQGRLDVGTTTAAIRDYDVQVSIDGGPGRAG